ncbi:serine-rich adhesin for platelets-like [Ptychodera flava]|uniref:serine-rich adhesin for platelets-like n=1 Tax=Ptychodera flava TaxID=63121 RepID=UPI00396A0EC4
MDGELSCSICLELLETPVILPCSHNFCKKCIRSLLYIENGDNTESNNTTFNCPTCRCGVELRSRDLADLQVNRILENVIKLYKDEQKAQTRSKSACIDHEESLIFYCCSCHVLVCCLCREESGKHEHHDVQLLKDMYRDTLTQLDSDVHKLREMVHEAKKDFKSDELVKHARKRLEEASKEIDKKCSELVTLIKQKQEVMKLVLTAQKKEFDLQLGLRKSTIESADELVEKYNESRDNLQQEPSVSSMKVVRETSCSVKHKLALLMCTKRVEDPIINRFMHVKPVKTRIASVFLSSYPEFPVSDKAGSSIFDVNTWTSVIPWATFSSSQKKSTQHVPVSPIFTPTMEKDKTTLVKRPVRRTAQSANDSVLSSTSSAVLIESNRNGRQRRMRIPSTGARASHWHDKEGSSSEKTAFQCITAMKKYEQYSLEELRLEDYGNNRKGSQGSLTRDSLTWRSQPSFCFADINTIQSTAISCPSSGQEHRSKVHQDGSRPAMFGFNPLSSLFKNSKSVRPLRSAGDAALDVTSAVTTTTSIFSLRGVSRTSIGTSEVVSQSYSNERPISSTLALNSQPQSEDSDNYNSDTDIFSVDYEDAVSINGQTIDLFQTVGSSTADKNLTQKATNKSVFFFDKLTEEHTSPSETLNCKSVFSDTSSCEQLKLTSPRLAVNAKYQHSNETGAYPKPTHGSTCDRTSERFDDNPIKVSLYPSTAPLISENYNEKMKTNDLPKKPFLFSTKYLTKPGNDILVSENHCQSLDEIQRDDTCRSDDDCCPSMSSNDVKESTQEHDEVKENTKFHSSRSELLSKSISNGEHELSMNCIVPNTPETSLLSGEVNSEKEKNENDILTYCFQDKIKHVENFDTGNSRSHGSRDLHCDPFMSMSKLSSTLPGLGKHDIAAKPISRLAEEAGLVDIQETMNGGSEPPDQLTNDCKGSGDNSGQLSRDELSEINRLRNDDQWSDTGSPVIDNLMFREQINTYSQKQDDSNVLTVSDTIEQGKNYDDQTVDDNCNDTQTDSMSCYVNRSELGFHSTEDDTVTLMCNLQTDDYSNSLSEDEVIATISSLSSDTNKSDSSKHLNSQEISQEETFDRIDGSGQRHRAADYEQCDMIAMNSSVSIIDSNANDNSEHHDNQIIFQAESFEPKDDSFAKSRNTNHSHNTDDESITNLSISINSMGNGDAENIERQEMLQEVTLNPKDDVVNKDTDASTKDDLVNKDTNASTKDDLVNKDTDASKDDLVNTDAGTKDDLVNKDTDASKDDLVNKDTDAGTKDDLVNKDTDASKDDLVNKDTDAGTKDDLVNKDTDAGTKDDLVNKDTDASKDDLVNKDTDASTKDDLVNKDTDASTKDDLVNKDTDASTKDDLVN